MSIIYKIMFIIFSLYFLVQSISYSIYEFKKEQNKYGSICFILVVILTIIFSNIMFFINI